MEPFLVEVKQKIDNAINHLEHDLATIRAGRANPSLIEEIPVVAYGTRMKLMEVGTISAPQPTLLTVQIWDIALVKDVIKSLQEANLGLNPSSEGQVIRLPIPPLTAERREEFIKLAHQKMEDARIEIRQIRQDGRSSWKRDEESGEIGSDEFERRGKLLQDLVDSAMDQVEVLGKKKTAELQQI